MNSQRKRYDLTAADTKIIGTDYQFFYFIKELMKMKKGHQVGYEVKDDVHVTLSCGKLVLIQLKHTTQKQANGQPINLSELDDDLLHTIYNWILLICDKNDNRSSYEQQKLFIENASFILATNKTISANKFISNMQGLKNNTLGIKDFALYLSDLSKATKSSTKEYIDSMLNLNSQLLEMLIKSITIEVQADTIIDEIRDCISEKYMRKDKINDAFSDIFFEMKEDFYNCVNAGEKFMVSYEDWQPRGITIFEKYRTTNLPIRSFEPAIPANFQEQPFVQELIGIGDLERDEIEQMAEYTGFMLEIEMNLKEWYDNGDITLQQMNQFHNYSKTFWKNAHRKIHRTTTLINDSINALSCLDELRNKELEFEYTSLNIQLSNGEFYHLSNNREIGWVKKWEDKYKK